jgi:integrase/recombinase XerC/integrase/recombinase XerD
LHEFLTDLGNASPHTIRAYRGDPLAFAAHHDGGPGAVTAAPVRAYLAETANPSPATLLDDRGHVALLKMYLDRTGYKAGPVRDARRSGKAGRSPTSPPQLGGPDAGSCLIRG